MPFKITIDEELAKHLRRVLDKQIEFQKSENTKMSIRLERLRAIGEEGLLADEHERGIKALDELIDLRRQISGLTDDPSPVESLQRTSGAVDEIKHTESVSVPEAVAAHRESTTATAKRPVVSSEVTAPKKRSNTPIPIPSMSNGDEMQFNHNVTPLSEAAARIGRTLNDPFTPTDIAARLDGHDAKARAYQWAAAWKNKGWIETAGFGIYKKTATFGQ